MSGEMIEAEIERLAADVARLTEDRDEWRAEATRLTNAGTGLIVMLNTAQADVERLTTERDNWQQRAETLEQAAQRLTVENEGLRFDFLRAMGERDNWKNEALGVQLVSTPVEDQLRQAQDKIAMLTRGAESADAIIQGLREALERSDKRLLQAKARQIPPALVGLLGVIRREAAAAEKMIL